MAAGTHENLTMLSLDNPLPNPITRSHERDTNLGVIHRYVIDGEALDRGALDDMFKNPESLLSQVDALEGWVEAGVAGEDGVWLEKRAAERLNFMKIVVIWSVEAGNGSADIHANRTSGNGSDGLPSCSVPDFTPSTGQY